VVIDLDQVLATDLPENSLYIRSDWLKVLDRPEIDGTPNKQMEGRGKVYIQGRDFWARGESVYYNQLKRQVIISGKDGSNATLYQQTRPGEKGRTVEAKQIIYNRATGTIDILGASSMSGESVPKR
jgi:lipopolysaccharide export system protein LptA